MLLHPRPLLRVNTSAIESDSSSTTNNATTSSSSPTAVANNNNAAPGVVKHVWVDTSSDDIVIVTEKNTLHFCRINAVTQGDSALLDILTLHPARETTAARRFVSRTSAKMHAGLCALTFDAEKLLIFNAVRNVTAPIGAFSCQPNSLRFRDPYYPILRFEWLPQRVGCNYDTSRIYMAVVCSICIELVQVFPLAGSQDTAVRKLQRFVTHTDFCAVDPTSRRLSILSVNSSRKGVLKFFVINDPVAEAHHNRQYLMYNNNNARKSSQQRNNKNAKTALSSTTATPGASAHNSPNITRGQQQQQSSQSTSNPHGALAVVNVTGDPTIEHHLELKIDEEAVVDPQFAFREMFPDVKNKTKAPNYFYRLITIYGEHYCAVVTRSEVVLYRYDSSIPFFSARPDSFVPNSISSSGQNNNNNGNNNNSSATTTNSVANTNNNPNQQPLVVRPYRSFVLNLPQADKYSLLVLDNEIILQSLTPPFLCFSYDIALDQASTANMRDLELTECMRRIGGLGAHTATSSSAAQQQNRAASPSSSSSSANPNASFLLNPMMSAASGPNFNPGLSGSFSGGKSSSSSSSYMTTPSNLLLPPNLDQSSYDYYSKKSSSSSSENNNGSNSGNSSSSNTTSEPSAFAKLANLISLPTLHVSSNSNARLIPLKPKIPAPLENIPLPELAGGGGIFCDTSEPIFLSLGTDFLQRLAAGGQTRLPPEQMVAPSANNNNNNNNTRASTWTSMLFSGNSSKKKTQQEDLGNPNSTSNGCNAANIEVYLIGKDKAKRDLWMNSYSNSSSPQQSQHNSPTTKTLHQQQQQDGGAAAAVATTSNSLLQNTGATASLCARGGAIGRDNFRALFSNAIKNQQSLADIEKLLDDAVAGFILASCGVEPPISVSGMRVVGRWQLDHGSSAKRSGAAPWAMPLLSEAEVRAAERGADVGNLADELTMMNNNNNNDAALQQQQQQQDQEEELDSSNNVIIMNNNTNNDLMNNNDVSSDDNRGRRGRLESPFPLVIAGAATSASSLQDYGTSVTAPAAHLQLVIAEILATHVHEACIQNAAFGGNDPVSLARLRYLRGVGLEVLRCFRCLIIYPLQQAIVDSYVCGLTINYNNGDNQQQQQQMMTVGGDLMDLWGLLQLISFRFLAESPQLAAKLIEVGVRVRIRQLVQAGLDMLGRLGAFHELGTVLLHLGDVLAATRIACKHNLHVVASKAIVRAYLMDKEFSEKGKECFSAAAKRKVLPLVLMMLRSRGGGGGSEDTTTASNNNNNNNSASPREGSPAMNNMTTNAANKGQFSAVIESTLKGLQLA